MSRLVCPYCGSFTSFSPGQVIGKGILRERSSEDNTILGEVQISAIFPYSAGYGDKAYAILYCEGCDEFFVAQKELYSSKDRREWIAVYPIQHKVVPDEIPEPIKSEVKEANLCFAIEAFKACILMCQTALEHVWHEQGVSGLKELKDNGIISPQLYKRANEIRLWGNMAKHEMMADPVIKEDAEQLVSYLEILLNEVYVEPKRLDSLAEKRKELEK